MKKIIKIEEIVCDFCSRKAVTKCECCGKDICNECARWICRKEMKPQSGGPTLTWGGANNFLPYPWIWKEEKTLCKDCVENFKFAIGALAGNANRRNGMSKMQKRKAKKNS